MPTLVMLSPEVAEDKAPDKIEICLIRKDGTRGKSEIQLTRAAPCADDEDEEFVMKGECDRLIVLRVMSPPEAEVLFHGDGHAAWAQAQAIEEQTGARKITLRALRQIAEANPGRRLRRHIRSVGYIYERITPGGYVSVDDRRSLGSIVKNLNALSEEMKRRCSRDDDTEIEKLLRLARLGTDI
jgi:hypothetical protein